MIRHFIVLSACTLALICGAASAEETAATNTPPYLLQGIAFDRSINCEKATTNYELGQCRALEIQAQESELLKQLQQLNALLKADDEALAALEQAHQSWVVWQWHEAKLCANHTGFSEDGSGFGLTLANCRAAQIATRQQQLAEYLTTYRSRLSR